MEGWDRVSIEDLQKVLRTHGLITFPREVKPLFTRFDKDKDGFVDFHDFKHELEPVKPSRYGTLGDLKQ